MSEETTPKPRTVRSSSATTTASESDTDVDLLPDDHPHKVAIEQGYFGELDEDREDATLGGVTSR